MAANGGGVIVNTTSIGGINAGAGVMAYRATKAAVIHFTRSIAVELAAHEHPRELHRARAHPDRDQRGDGPVVDRARDAAAAAGGLAARRRGSGARTSRATGPRRSPGSCSPSTAAPPRARRRARSRISWPPTRRSERGLPMSSRHRHSRAEPSSTARGAPGRVADVAIADGVIVEIGPDLRGERELDASGCAVAPGFIDIHTHYDAQVFWDPALRPSSFHGVTTVVAGNCGFSIAPTRARTPRPHRGHARERRGHGSRRR